MAETYRPLRSTNIAEVTYDRTEKTLAVRFQSGGLYVHSGVPVEVFLGMQNAASAGEYYHRHLKNRYGVERVE